MSVKVKFVGQEVSQSLKDVIQDVVDHAYNNLKRVNGMSQLAVKLLKVKYPELEVDGRGDITLSIDAANTSVRDIIHMVGINYYSRIQYKLEQAFADTKAMQ